MWSFLREYNYLFVKDNFEFGFINVVEYEINVGNVKLIKEFLCWFLYYFVDIVDEYV